MTHYPNPTRRSAEGCEHLWSGWSSEREQLPGSSVFVNVLRRKCFNCGQVEDSQQLPDEAPEAPGG